MLDPIRPVDDTARALARGLISLAQFGALGVLDPLAGGPLVSRVAVAVIAGRPHLLISALAQHAQALAADPRCSLLVGEPGPKGDPLTHPRLTVQARAEPADKTAGRATWLAAHPKAQVYYDFADFALLRLAVTGAFLNGGFGKAYRLTAQDLTSLPSPAPP